MDRQLFVYVDLAGRPVLVGRLWTRVRKGNESATFEYDRQWLAHPTRFSLEPALTLGPGPYHTPAGRALFGALGDSAPDRWGRVLMRRAERRRADQEKRSPRTLSEADFLLMVDDEARLGALRFAESEGGPLDSNRTGGIAIPPFIELPHLLAASERVLSEKRRTRICACCWRPVPRSVARVPKPLCAIAMARSRSRSFRRRRTKCKRYDGKR
jgi:serine/threonine-protein kinase HipA